MTTSPTSDHDPWARAYEIFEKREPELMADYKTHPASLQPDPATGADLSIPQSVKSIVENLLEAREKRQWQVTLLGKDIQLRKQAEKLSKFLLWTDSVARMPLAPSLMLR